MLVSAKNISKSFFSTKVLDSVSIDIAAGDKIALMGPNGAGKTTLVRALLGFYHIDSGDLSVLGKDPIKDRVEVLKSISFIPQTPPPVKLSLDELIGFISKTSNIEKEKIIAEATKMDLDILAHKNKPFFKLSGGMKQKLLIAIALSRDSKLLIFDEPTANLDPKGREQFYNLLTKVPQEHSTLFITHRVDEIEGLINRVVYMDLGKVVEDEMV